ncbi:MAG: DNA-processing protein DprA [Christensenellaceae bacterium]
MINLTSEEKYWVWLSTVRGIGPVKFYDIINYFEDAKTAWENVGEISHIIKGIGDATAKNLIQSANDSYIEDFLKELDTKQIKMVTRLDQCYPQTLANIENPPPLLYYKGILPDFEDRTCGMVGSRRPTKFGFNIAHDISYNLASQNVLIISGLARGIDTAAHTGALDAGGITAAVVGCGVDVIYPAENRNVYEKIIENGVILSEFPPGEEPLAKNFPQRNRIIAGLSQALIVGEGGEKSGARITADYALRQGIDIYATVCDLKSTMAKLPLYLLDSGSMMITDGYEVMRSQKWEINAKKRKAKNKSDNKLDLFEAQIYNLLLKEDLSAEELANYLEANMKDVNTAITVMELKSLISSLPGGKFSINN